MRVFKQLQINIIATLLVISVFFALIPIISYAAIPTRDIDTGALMCEWTDSNTVVCSNGSNINETFRINNTTPDTECANQCEEIFDGQSYILISDNSYTESGSNGDLLLKISKDYSESSIYFLRTTFDDFINSSTTARRIGVLEELQFDYSNVPSRAPINISGEVAPSGTLIAGLIHFITRTEGEFIQEDWVDSLTFQLRKGAVDGELINIVGCLSGFGTGVPSPVPGTAGCSRDIVKSGENYFYNGFTILEPLLVNTEYVLALGTKEDNYVSCVTGHDDAWWRVAGENCTLYYKGYTKFTILEDGSIHIVSSTNSPEINKSIEGLKITELARAKSGVDITVVETLDSPIDKVISNAIKWVLGGVTAGLKWTIGNIDGLLNQTVDLVIGAKTDDRPALYTPWVSIRNVAISLLVMGLIIIAFANVMQINIEQYGLNRMIPRIIISIIMAFASWIIVVFFFDLTAAIQNQAKYLANGIDILKTLETVNVTTPSTSQIIANLAILIVVIVLLIGVWACGIVLMFTLLLRIVMLAFLLVVAPLAFILNIMPFTANLYKQWWSEFFKWMFMGPIALAIIALGGVIANSVGFSYGSGSQNIIDPSNLDMMLTATGSRGGVFMGLAIFAAALYMAATLPMQWGGKLMGSWAKAGNSLWGKASGAAKWGAMNVGGKYSANRMLGNGKMFFANRKTNQDAQDKAQLSRWQDQMAGSSKLGRNFATGLSEKDAASAALVQHRAAVDASGAQHGMEKWNKTKLVGALLDPGTSEYQKEFAARTLASRGLLDMDNNEMRTTARLLGFDEKMAEGLDKQSIFDHFVTRDPDFENIAMDKHKDLILGSNNPHITDDLKNKALNKMLDSSPTKTTAAEMEAAIKIAGNKNSLLNEFKNKGGNADIRSVYGDVEHLEGRAKQEAKEKNALSSAYGKFLKTNTKLTDQQILDEIQKTNSAQKAVTGWTKQHVVAVSKTSGGKRLGAFSKATSDDILRNMMKEGFAETVEAAKSGDVYNAPRNNNPGVDDTDDGPEDY